jgi:hypothetical protein
MRKTDVELQQAREQSSDYFDDADVLPDEDTHARLSAQDEWERPRKIELALPTLAVLTAACVMALFYQATHPYELDEAPDTPVQWGREVREVPRTVAAQDALPNVAGAWTIATHVESSSYTPFNGLQLARSAGRVEARRIR